jgi:hypothetical protein
MIETSKTTIAEWSPDIEAVTNHLGTLGPDIRRTLSLQLAG